eukprot:s1332_g9.t1
MSELLWCDQPWQQEPLPALGNHDCLRSMTAGKLSLAVSDAQGLWFLPGVMECRHFVDSTRDCSDGPRATLAVLRPFARMSIDIIELYNGDRRDRPFRAHQSWKYPWKIRRHDHYCRASSSSQMGAQRLLNYHEFVLVLVGLCLIGLPRPQLITVRREVALWVSVGLSSAISSFGVLLDGYVAMLLAKKGMWEAEIAGLVFAAARVSEGFLHLRSHLAFSVIVPFFRVHIGLLSRNELGQESKNNGHYVAWSSCIRFVSPG